jgi:hypothetical protein
MLSHTLAATQATQFAKSMVAQSTAVIEATRLAKYSLSAVIAATQSNAPLPNPDVIAQNHKSWMETTKQMGVTKKSSNCLRPAEESGLTAQSIGVVKGKRMKPNAPSTVNAAPPVESTPGITLLGPTIVPPPPCAPGIVPPGPAIPVQVDAFAPPPTCTPRIMPPGPAFTTLLEALAFYAVAPPIEFTTST